MGGLSSSPRGTPFTKDADQPGPGPLASRVASTLKRIVQLAEAARLVTEGKQPYYAMVADAQATAAAYNEERFLSRLLACRRQLTA